jgi:hypothetical protein
VLEHLGTTATVSAVTNSDDVLYAKALFIRDGSPYALPDPIDEGVVVPSGPDDSRYVSADAINDDGTIIVGTAGHYLACGEKPGLG